MGNESFEQKDTWVICFGTNPNVHLHVQNAFSIMLSVCVCVRVCVCVCSLLRSAPRHKLKGMSSMRVD